MPQASMAPHELLLELEPDADAKGIAASVEGAIEGEVRFSRRYARLVLQQSASRALCSEVLAAQTGVRAVHLNPIVTPSYLRADQAPDDPFYAIQWPHRVTHIKEAWQALGTSFSAANTILAVVDSGVDQGHPDLAGRVLTGKNFTTDHPDLSLPLVNDVTDLIGHGTHVAGIAAGRGNDAQGMSGVAWDAKILPVKVVGQSSSTLFQMLQGIQYAADYSSGGMAVRVVNVSLGIVGYFGTDALAEDALSYAWNKGVVVVISSGNEGGSVTDPAINPHGLVVSSTSCFRVGGFMSEYASGFSNRGDRIDLAAPGSNIFSSLPRNTNTVSTSFGLLTRAVGDNSAAIDPPYGFLSGTSMAAPYVAGVAALVAARYDPYNLDMNASFADRVASRLKVTADDMGPPGKDPFFGYGRVNAQRALGPASL